MTSLGVGDDDFNRPWLLLCEGWSDVRFFEKLFEHHGIGKDFIIKKPSKPNDPNFGGRECFGEYLDSIATNQTFIDNVEVILVVADSDDDPAANSVKDEIVKANKLANDMDTELPIPTAERTMARATNRGKSIVVLLLPMDSPGNLESLCLTAAYSRWPIETELDEFVSKTPASGWSAGKQAKMRMQTILAANNEKQPDAGFASSWTKKEKYRVPVNHACFDELVSFIRDFLSLVDTQ